MAGEFSYYDLLGVESSASHAEIHSAYRAAVLRYHPDINSAPNATRLAAMLNEAHRILSTTVGRAAYDATLVSRRATPSVYGDRWSQFGGLSAVLLVYPWLFAWRMLRLNDKRGAPVLERTRSKPSHASTNFNTFPEV